MNNLTMIAAVGKNLELGKKNELIWHFKEDMTFFKNNTINKTVVMGRNTYESIGRDLPNRKNIVLTSRNIKNDNIITINNIENILKYIKENKEEIMIIGGAKVYQEFLSYASNLLLTEIESIDDKADTFFPRFNKEDFNKKILSEHIDEKTNIEYKHVLYKRKKPTM